MRKILLLTAIALTMVVLFSASAFAGRGEWYMNANESTGSLSAGSHVAYWNRDQGAVATREAGLQWTVVYGADPTTKCIDMTSTVGSGTGAYWNLNDQNPGGNVYSKLGITPGNSVYDNSRGMVMAKIKVNSAGAVSGTFGFSSTLNGGEGMLICLRDNIINMKDAAGNNVTFDSVAVDVKTDYRVYALSWEGTTANAWYSTTNDWSGNSANWVQLGSWTMGYGTGAAANGGGVYSGILLADLSSDKTWDGNTQWVSHTTYDAPLLAPWANDPTPNIVPEPGSLLALACGVIGMAGFTIRRKRA